MSELPKHWQATTSGEICEYITSGSRDWRSYYSDDGPLFVRTQDINQDRLDLSEVAHVNLPEKVEGKRSLILPGDLLVTITGANVGKVALVPNDIPEAYVSQSVGLMRLRDNRNGPYLHYYLQSDRTGRQQVLDMVYGIGRPVLSLQNLRDIPVALPPLPEQRRIVAEIEKQFTRLEAGVKALRRVQANLKRYRAAVLKAACEGRLVPTEAERLKAEGRRLKDFESGEQLLKRILSERRQNWQGRGQYKEPAVMDSDIQQEIPEGWAVCSVGQVSECLDGKRVPINKEERAKRHGDIPYYGANGQVGWIDDYLFDEPLVLVVEDETFTGRTQAFSYVIRGKTWVNNHAHVLRATGAVSTAYLNYSLAHYPFTARTTGSTGRRKLTQKALIAAPYLLPPLAEQARIVAEVERRLSVVEELESVVTANLQRATRLRQSILQKAFTGELVVKSLVLPTNVIEFPKAEHNQRPNTHFARALLSAEIVHRLHREPTFGRIKHQKIFHLCEHIAEMEEIHGQYHREAAGPLDNKLIYANEAELKKQKWYQEVHRESFGHAYEPLAKAGKHRKYMEGYWPDKLPLIEKLIELMRGWNTDRCEIFCTTYAAWNDLLILGKEPTEVAILREILERWHDSKKRFPEDRWCKAIGWMRKKGFVPTGFGRPTKVMQRK